MIASGDTWMLAFDPFIMSRVPPGAPAVAGTGNEQRRLHDGEGGRLTDLVFQSQG